MHPAAPEFAPEDVSRWSGGRWSGPVADPLRGVSTDTRALPPGCLYIALQGERFDGHDFLPDAFRGGARAALVRRGQRCVAAAGPLLEVDDTRVALMRLAKGYREALNLTAVAVTGSVGKTTVKEMTADVLSTLAPTARTRGNWNNDIGLPLSLLSAPADTRFGVYEVGMNHPGELKPLCELLRPVCSVVTTIGPVHLEFFGGVREIALEKSAVLHALPLEGVGILCLDDPWYPVLRAEAHGPVLTTSLERDADFQVVSRRGTRFAVRERASGLVTEIALPQPGDFMVHDALLASAVGRQAGVPWPRIAEALAGYRPQPMRWQAERRSGVLFINDAYNANPLSMRAALQAFREQPTGRDKWVVLAGMRELGATERAEHEELGRRVAEGPWAGLVAVGWAGAWLAEGARAAGFPLDRIHRADDARAAAALLKQLVREGDAVLLKASRGEKLEELLAGWPEKEEESPCHPGRNAMP